MSIHGITPKENINSGRKILKKNKSSNKFEVSDEHPNETEEIQSENINIIGNVNPFIFLNEINNEEAEKEILKKNGEKIIICLDKIRLCLLDGSFDEEYIIRLKKNLEKISYKFSNPNLQNIIDQIILRAEVEYEKIKINVLN